MDRADPTVILRNLRAAWKLILKHRWLVGVPAGLTAFGYLLGLPFQLRARARMGELYPWYQSGRIISPMWSVSRLQTTALDSIRPAFRYSVRFLDGAYVNIFGGYFALISFFAAAVLCKIVMDFFKKEVGNQYAEQLGLIKKMLIAGLVLMPISWAFGTVLIRGHDQLGERLFFSACNSFVRQGILLSVITVFEGVMLSSIAHAVQDRPIVSSEVLGDSLSGFVPLYAFNLILVAVSTLLLILPLLLQNPSLPRLNLWMEDMIEPGIRCFFLLVPFFIVFKKQSLSEAFRHHIEFIRKQILNYALILFCGICILFVPEYIEYGLSSMFNPGHFLHLDFRLGMSMLSSVLDAWFVVALINWFYESSVSQGA